jgi:hypothetical protein
MDKPLRHRLFPQEIHQRWQLDTSQQRTVPASALPTEEEAPQQRMAHEPIARQLRNKLEEVDLVFRLLPPLLDRAGLKSNLAQWRRRWAEEASNIRRQHLQLQDGVERWGQRLFPCSALEATTHLNELQYTLRAFGGKPEFELRAQDSVQHLHALVGSRLSSARKLAALVGAEDLVESLGKLLAAEMRHALGG